MQKITPSKTLNYDWQSLARSVESAFQGEQLSKAEDLCWESISKAKLLGELEPRLAISLSNLAVIQRLRGQYDRAEDLSNIALRIFQAIDAQGPLMTKALLNAASFFFAQGRWGEARRLYNKAIGLLELNPQDEILCQALCLLARLYSEQAKYSQAENLLKRVSSLQPKIPRVRLLYLLTSAQNSIYQERLTRAEKHLEQADEILQNKLELQDIWNSSRLAVQSGLLAHRYGALKQLSGAQESEVSALKAEVIESYSRALKLREQSLGPFHSSCSTILRRLAQFYFDLSSYQSCEQHLRSALSICLSSRGAYHPETLQCLELSALVLRATNRHDEAESMEERSRQVEKKVREQARETLVAWGQTDSKS